MCVGVHTCIHMYVYIYILIYIYILYNIYILKYIYISLTNRNHHHLGGRGDHQTLGHTYYIYNVYPHGHRIPISTETVVGSTHQTPVSERRLGPVPDHPAEANEWVSSWPSIGFRHENDGNWQHFWRKNATQSANLKRFTNTLKVGWSLSWSPSLVK